MTLKRTQVLSYEASGAIADAASLLRSGELVAAATETVYGLAADASNDDAIKKIYQTKGRPSHNPLICHVLDKDMAESLVVIPPIAAKLIERFWPGPLTLVLPAKPDNNVAPTVSAGLDTLAVRAPAHPAMRRLIAEFGDPIAAPSANLSGKLSPTSASDVLANFDGKIDLILDGGTTDIGLESTIVLVTEDAVEVLRPGSVTPDMIGSAANCDVSISDSKEILAPGQLKSHYAPNAQLRLNVTIPESGEVFIGFGDNDGDFNLSKTGDLKEAAHALFRTLRAADKMGTRIAVASIPYDAIGIAINDRLKRAAAPRDQEQ